MAADAPTMNEVNGRGWSEQRDASEAKRLAQIPTKNPIISYIFERMFKILCKKSIFVAIKKNRTEK
jgi:hypothetical protein